METTNGILHPPARCSPPRKAAFLPNPPKNAPLLILAIFALLSGAAFAPSASTPADSALPKAGGEAVSLAAPRADSLIRIRFAAGTTSGAYGGTLASGGSQSYILWAGWNQAMIVRADAPGSQTYLEIYNYWTGIRLCSLSSALSSWQGYLPRTGDYIVRLQNNAGGSDTYSLSVKIPARIQFARGAYSKSVWGKGSAAQTISYVLWARAGQTMTASVSSSTGASYLNIYGFSGGQSLVSSSSSQTSWTGALPQSQDYIVEVVQGGTWVDFTLTVTIV
ncbi:MAG: hypothetical protein JW929_14120 [Anaerolineales bacterium]|nr:hypothetical protein [Anaerolineales bacterium]